MTLVVAGIEDGVGWLVADTAITGGPIDLRTRQYEIKVYPIGSYGLVAFAGDLNLGQQILHKLSGVSDSNELLSAAEIEIAKCPSVDLALMFLKAGTVQLYKVTHEGAQPRAQLHLGNSEAFQHFQEIRHSLSIDHPPDAMIQFVSGPYGTTNVPRSCNSAITAMISLFASRTDHDVGGWPLPYILGTEGPSLVSYAYSTTDPVMVGLPLGTPIQFGTASAGGFALSLTRASEVDGVVVYWLQMPGGRVFARERSGYSSYHFNGGPAEFGRNVRERLGFEPSLWFGEESTLVPKYINIISDHNGLDRLAINSDGNNFNFTWLGNNTDASFSIEHQKTMDDPFEQPVLTRDGSRIEFEAQSDTRLKITIIKAEISVSCDLDASELDSFLRQLSAKRAELNPEVPMERPRGVPHVVTIDPVWRTEPSPDPSAGALLWLRHPGAGWIGGNMPSHEAKNLGNWLVTYADQAMSKPDSNEQDVLG